MNRVLRRQEEVRERLREDPDFIKWAIRNGHSSGGPPLTNLELFLTQTLVSYARWSQCLTPEECDTLADFVGTDPIQLPCGPISREITFSLFAAEIHQHHANQVARRKIAGKVAYAKAAEACGEM